MSACPFVLCGLGTHLSSARSFIILASRLLHSYYAAFLQAWNFSAATIYLTILLSVGFWWFRKIWSINRGAAVWSAASKFLSMALSGTTAYLSDGCILTHQLAPCSNSMLLSPPAQLPAAPGCPLTFACLMRAGPPAGRGWW